MHDKIFDIVKDPTCILAVTPDSGGSWVSPLRPNQPRSFKTNPKTWTDFESVAQEQGNSELQFDITMGANSASGTYAYGFYAMGSTFRISVFQSGSDIKYGPAIEYADGTSLNAAPIRPVGKSIRISFVLKSTACEIYADGVLLSSDNGSKYTGYSKQNNHFSKFDGSISEAKLTNLTTNTVVWEASHSDLWDTNNPWPSPVPRNFATEPAAWYDIKTWFDNAPAETMTFDFEFEQLSAPITGKTSLFSNGGNSPFGCEWIIASADRFAFRIYFYGLYDTGAIHAPYLQVILNASTVLGKHLVHAEASDGLFTVTMDGTTVTSAEVGSRLTGSFTGVQKTSADCTIKRLSFSVPGYRRFNYPSEAERVRLLTYGNVRTDRGVFEAADTSKTARVDTALDLRGRVSSYTLFVDFEAADLASMPENYCKQELAGQGAATGSIASPLAVNYNKQLNVSTILYRFVLRIDIAGATHMLQANLPDRLIGRNSVVAVVELMDDKTRLSIYHCGVLLKSEIVNGIPKMNGYACPNSFALMDNRNGLLANYYGNIYSCLLFDRALKPAEIAAISQC